MYSCDISGWGNATMSRMSTVQACCCSWFSDSSGTPGFQVDFYVRSILKNLFLDSASIFYPISFWIWPSESNRIFSWSGCVVTGWTIASSSWSNHTRNAAQTARRDSQAAAGIFGEGEEAEIAGRDMWRRVYDWELAARRVEQLKGKSHSLISCHLISQTRLATHHREYTVWNAAEQRELCNVAKPINDMANKQIDNIPVSSWSQETGWR